MVEPKRDQFPTINIRGSRRVDRGPRTSAARSDGHDCGAELANRLEDLEFARRAPDSSGQDWHAVGHPALINAESSAREANSRRERI
jgi:hypothetical protein